MDDTYRCLSEKKCEAHDGTVEGAVAALLNCRGFTMDVLMGGKWTGCYRHKVKQLTDTYGRAAVSVAFGSVP